MLVNISKTVKLLNCTAIDSLNKPYTQELSGLIRECGAVVFLGAKKKGEKHCAALLAMHEWLYLAKKQKQPCFSLLLFAFQILLLECTITGLTSMANEMQDNIDT